MIRLSQIPVKNTLKRVASLRDVTPNQNGTSTGTAPKANRVQTSPVDRRPEYRVPWTARVGGLVKWLNARFPSMDGFQPGNGLLVDTTKQATPWSFPRERASDTKNRTGKSYPSDPE